MHEIGDNGLSCLFPLTPLIHSSPFPSSGTHGPTASAPMVRASTQESPPGEEDYICPVLLSLAHSLDPTCLGGSPLCEPLPCTCLTPSSASTLPCSTPPHGPLYAPSLSPPGLGWLTSPHTTLLHPTPGCTLFCCPYLSPLRWLLGWKGTDKLN